jgi:hypothetical protein
MTWLPLHVFEHESDESQFFVLVTENAQLPAEHE